ncbi:MAG: hypothetical protein IT378_04415 [Sandaracinaceae bacterium]|nr:hypothetical protein [Sandaracinaceae bacterium]
MRRLVILSLWIASAASAQAPGARADTLVAQALDARRAGYDAVAVDLFHAALAREPSPRALALCGLAEQALSRFADADAHLRLALAALDDPWITPRRAVLERALREAEAQVARVTLIGVPDGAAIRVDGRATMLAQGALSLTPGEHELMVEPPGRAPWVLRETFAAGAIERAVRIE